MEDIRLSRIKYARFSLVNSSFEGEIQRIRISKVLETNQDPEQIENIFLRYLIDIENVKSEDEDLCRILVEL